MPYAKPNKLQNVLFGEQEPWRDEWQGMPEYEQENLLPEYSIRINFVSYEEMQKFAALIDQKITSKTQSLWFPKQEKEKFLDKRYV